MWKKKQVVSTYADPEWVKWIFELVPTTIVNDIKGEKKQKNKQTKNKNTNKWTDMNYSMRDNKL